MNRDDIIRIAREAGFDSHDMSADFTCNLENIERFATLIAAAEREVCINLADSLGWVNVDDIRARGQHD